MNSRLLLPNNISFSPLQPLKRGEVGERNSPIDWATKKGDDGLREYWEQKNQISMNGLPTGLLEI
jgi:hypothetical protein